MIIFVQKGDEVKKIQSEDLAYFEYLGYRKTSKKVETVIPEPVKKGRKRTFDTEKNNEEE